ncbi:LysR substrate-binding domain-containing protein [Actinomadura rupiterrae]|uniref:LysR substrate-binding domain-containing protein n=1 Tax=Actinomadura rupiterrae TaxID=559627 RepID=UPI0020A28220|nr:LysR substrate-binding domain-containing protein [Actinomadura rupiterrae]MCP2335237.1 DNA-binding transcriptional LysR family regulator [Actinomadura rupiterrae]
MRCDDAGAIPREGAAALERSAGTALFERRPGGVRLTPAGSALLRHGRTILDALDAAERELTGETPRTELVRLGLFLSAGAMLLPATLDRLAAVHPEIRVSTREGTSPSLVRRCGPGRSMSRCSPPARPPYRPPGQDAPRLHVDTIDDTELLLAAPAAGEFSGRTSVHLDELADVAWIAAPSSSSEPLLGVWPGLPGHPRIVHSTRDWLTKLQLVAGGFGVTTVPARLSAVLPRGVALLRVEGAPQELRRILVARLPGRTTPAITAVTRAVMSAAG